MQIISDFAQKKSPKLTFQTFLLSNGLACYASTAAGSSAGASSPLASASAAAAS